MSDIVWRCDSGKGCANCANQLIESLADQLVGWLVDWWVGSGGDEFEWRVFKC